MARVWELGATAAPGVLMMLAGMLGDFVGPRIVAWVGVVGFLVLLMVFVIAGRLVDETACKPPSNN